MASVDSLVIDGVELLDKGSITFDYACAGNPLVISVTVRIRGPDAELIQCEVPWDNDAGEWPDSNITCTSRTFDIDAIAARNANLDHDLADVAKQQATSASKLPANQDLATVYGDYPPGSSIPLCSHWSSEFLRVPDDQLRGYKRRHGRIAGKDGERVFVHPTNPLLCRSVEDNGCDPKASVLPGDGVDVGFICGKWAYVKREPRVRPAPRTIIGWIETTRLYELDPLPAVTTATVAPTNAPAGLSDTTPLMRVAASDPEYDLEVNEKLLANPFSKAKTLLEAGANPNAHASDGSTALFFTIPANNVDIAELLLSYGADPNVSRNSFNTEQAMATGDAEGSTPLMETVSRYDRTRDPTLILELLNHHADPNYRNPTVLHPEQPPYSKYGNDFAGQTALTVAAQAGDYNVVRLLLQYGADPKLPRGDGETPAAIARENGHADVAALIEQFAHQKEPARRKAGS